MAYLLSPKGELLLFLSKQQGKLILNDSFKIFENYEDLMEIIYEVNAQNENIFKFIYFYEQNIHHVLYEFDKIININNFKLKMNFAELFYLDLLISDNVEIVNYTYNFELLINIFQLFNKKYKIGKDYKIALASNILLNLINNYCGTDNYNESINGEEINKMKNELENEINNNLDEFNKLLNISEENIKKLKIDDLYCKIVISLIKSNNLNDFNSLNNIFKEIELDKINIENKILPSLQEAFEENNEFMEKFIIKTEEDFDEKKINFYFILFKFILKSEFYIYQIPLLLKMKKIIIELIKSNKFKNDNNKFSKEIKDRLRYVLEIFAGSKYYFELNKEEINKLKTVLIYFKSFYFETKIEDIKKIEEDIKNKNENSIYLNYYKEAVEKNNIYPIIKNLYFISQNKEINSENALQESIKIWKTVYRLIKDRKFGKMRNKEMYSQYFKNNNNHKLLLNAFTKEDIDSFINYINNDKKIKKPQFPKEELSFNIIDDISSPAPAIAINTIKYDKFQNQEKQNDDNNLIPNLKKEENKEQANKLTPQGNKKSKKIDNSGSKIYLNNGDEESKLNQKNNEENNNNNNDEDIDIITNDYFSYIEKDLSESITIHLKTNERNKNIEYEKIYGKNNIEIPKNKFEQTLKYLKVKIGLKKFIQEIEYKIKTEFNHRFPLNLKIQIQKFSNNNFGAIYAFNDPIYKCTYKYKEENILINGTESNLQGFNFLIRDINQERYINLYGIDKPGNDDAKILMAKNEKQIPGLYNKASEIEILKIIKIIENNNSYNGFIKEINNEYFIYVNNDNIVVLLDEQFNPVMEIKDYYYKIVNICEQLPENQIFTENIIINKQNSKEDKKSNKSKKSKKVKSKSEENEETLGNKEFPKKNENSNVPQKIEYLKIVLCSNNFLYLTIINLKEKKTGTKKIEISKIFGFSSIEIKKNNYLIVGKNCTKYITDLFTNVAPKEILCIENESFFNSIRINDRRVALISNSVYPGGKDIMKFYNLKEKKFYQREIKEYSFIISPNGLELMPKINPDNKYRILLCACKKYRKEQKNGILLVNPQMEEKKDVENPFYDTNNFEVFCFCPILCKEGENSENNDDNGKLIDTNYFLVGGFDNDLREGKIMLYKINYGEKAFNTTIEYIQDINFKVRDEIKTFNGPINCLVQSSKTGNIIASCYDGNIYLLTPPNLNYYLEEDKNLTF